MKRTKYGVVITVALMVGFFAAFAAKPELCFSREPVQVSVKALDNAWSNLNLDEIDFKKAGLSEARMRETLARVCADFAAHPEKVQFLVNEVYTYAEFRDLYMSSSESVRRRIDVLLPQVLDNIFMGKDSVTEDIPFTDMTKGLATYLLNKKKMDAFRQLRRNETMMRRFAASIYKSLGTNDPALRNSLDSLFVTIANKKKYKIKKKTALLKIPLPVKPHTTALGPQLAFKGKAVRQFHIG